MTVFWNIRKNWIHGEKLSNEDPMGESKLVQILGKLIFIGSCAPIRILALFLFFSFLAISYLTKIVESLLSSLRVANGAHYIVWSRGAQVSRGRNAH